MFEFKKVSEHRYFLVYQTALNKIKMNEIPVFQGVSSFWDLEDIFLRGNLKGPDWR